MRPGLIQVLEQASVYAHRGQAPHPEIYSYRMVALTGSTYRVLSRIQEAGLDFTGRTNFIAHHLVYEPGEAVGANSPAEILLSWDGWKDRWEGEPATLPPVATIQVDRLDPPAKNWQKLLGDSSKAASPYAFSGGCWWISERYQEKQILTLMGESLRLNESEQELWSRSFTTYVGQILDPQQYNWKGWNGRDKRNEFGSKAAELNLDIPNDMPSGPTQMQQLASTGLRKRESKQNGIIKHQEVSTESTNRNRGSFPKNYKTVNKTYNTATKKPSFVKIILVIGCLIFAAILASSVFLVTKITENRNTNNRLGYLSEINKCIKNRPEKDQRFLKEIPEINDQNQKNSWIRLRAICVEENLSDAGRMELIFQAEQIKKKDAKMELAIQEIVKNYTQKVNEEAYKEKKLKEEKEKQEEQKRNNEEVNLRLEAARSVTVSNLNEVSRDTITPKQKVLNLVFKYINGVDMSSELGDDLKTYFVTETGQEIASFEKVKIVKHDGFLEKSWVNIGPEYVLSKTDKTILFQNLPINTNSAWLTIEQNKTNSLVFIIPNGKTVEITLTGKEYESAGKLISAASQLLGEDSQIVFNSQVIEKEKIQEMSGEGIYEFIKAEQKSNLNTQIENKKKEVSSFFPNTNLNLSTLNKRTNEFVVGDFENINAFAVGWLEDGDIPSNKKSLRNKTNTLSVSELQNNVTKNILIKRFPDLETNKLSFSDFLLKAQVIINEARSELYLNPIPCPLNTIKKSEFNEKYRLNKTNEHDALQIQKILNEIEQKEKKVKEVDLLSELKVQVMSSKNAAKPITFIIKKGN